MWLPIVVGLVSIALMAQRFEIPGWSCDAIGQQIDWHCDGADFTLELLSAPPMAVARQVENSWRAAPHFFSHVVGLPLILLWWWFIGTRLDFGLLGVGRYRHRRTWLGVLIGSVLLSLTVLAWSLWQGARVWSFSANPFLASIEDFRSLPVRLWLLILTFAFGLAALLVARGRSGQVDVKLAKPSTLRLAALGMGLYCIGAAWAVRQYQAMERQQLAEYQRRQIMIQGRVIDDRGFPIYGAEVELVPIFAKGDTPHDVADPAYTDENGEYTLRPYEGGKFILSVQGDAPPNTQLPFLSRFYPDATDPKQAKTLDIATAQHLTMNPIRLQRLELGKVPVSVIWSDGTPEPDVFFSFMNTSYPKVSAIGEMMPADPDGTVSLPVGFGYLGTVKTDCAKGESIESVFTTGWTFSLKSSNTITKPLRIVLPGNPCRKWHSK